MGREAARPCTVPRSELCSVIGISKEAKAAKIDSLIEKNFCARPLKNVPIFAGFACRHRAAAAGRVSQQNPLDFA
ncbi:MAG: hypothetical protein DRZ76_02570 [Candidatus Nealsonbacteria bacterium]|nr:MAG: hypothetical protein DRZ76_02570 [Candidatus Nealsonbacteria bacterium]